MKTKHKRKMKKTNKKREMMFGICIVLVLSFMSFISAFSVAMPYMENKQLYLYPGSTTDLQFILHDSGGTENINARVTIIEGSEIIEIIDSSNIYVVIPGPGKHTPVNFRITIPENARIGDSYHIKLGFAAEAGAGSFAFGSEIEQNFDVIIGEKAVEPAVIKEEEEGEILLKSFLFYGIIIFIFIIILIIFFVIRGRK
jgi:hypothetical protein